MAAGLTNGHNDYRRHNLRGKSFRGQALGGADFRQADLRGADFTRASLQGADFRLARTGLTQTQILGLGLLLLLLFMLSGFIIGYSTGVTASLLIAPRAAAAPDSDINPYVSTAAGLSLAVLAAFFMITLRRGLGFSGATAVTLAAAVAMVAAFGTAAVATAAIVQALAIAGAVAGVFYGAVATAAVMAMVNGRWWLWGMSLVTVLSAALGILFGVPETVAEGLLLAFAIAFACSIVLLGLGRHAGRLAWGGAAKYRLIRTVAIALTARGTCFRGADLTDADFSEAALGNTDLRQAQLLRTHWHRSTNLEKAHRDGTYLAQEPVRRLVVTKDGREQSFAYQDLRGLNLSGANLSDADLTGADLGTATLEGADLSRARLVRAQLHNTNLTAACLTGAYIQDWGISTTTRLEQVRCDYVYMQLPSKADPDPCRKPDNRSETFQENDFSDFMAPIIKTLDLYRQQHVDPREVAQSYKTLDLYHHEGIDPQAAAIALKALADQHPDADLQVVALEGRGQERVRLQAQVLGDVDRSELSAAYFEQYTRLKALPYGDIQALLAGMAEKDERIRSLETIVTNAMQNDRFYVETYYQLGDTVAEKNAPNSSSGGGDVSYVGGDIRDVSGVVSLGQISGEVTNTIDRLAADSDLKELLTELQTAIEAAPDLSGEDRAEALTQVKTLAEAGQSAPDGPIKRGAKTAIKILKGTAAGLADTTQLVEEFNRLLPAIATLIGLL